MSAFIDHHRDQFGVELICSKGTRHPQADTDFDKRSNPDRSSWAEGIGDISQDAQAVASNLAGATRGLAVEYNEDPACAASDMPAAISRSSSEMS